MTSNLKRTLGGMLTLAVVFSAAEARAQSLEKPGAPPSEASSAAAANAASNPAAFGDAGQFVISSEQLFGYTWRHISDKSGSASSNSFSLLADSQGTGASGYSWPRLGFDYFALKGISLGGAASFFRESGGGSSLTGFELAPRVGYATMVGPWLGVWPRLGFAYIHASSQYYSAVTLDVPLVITATPHLAILVAPSLDIGIAGTNSTKVTDAGLTFGLALTF
ncbi:MAG TPA: hypothetical protein VFG23_23910 [Polyangia bacterium]|nr:hypothetical protein [Polyangia bacterium]